MLKTWILIASSQFFTCSLFAQNYFKLENGTTTSLNSTVTAPRVYYGNGKLILSSGFSVNGSNGLFFASTIANPIQLNAVELYSPVELRLNITNIGALVYIARLEEVGTPLFTEFFLETSPANFGSVNRIYATGLKPNTLYACSVRAYGGVPNVNTSNAITVTTPACNLSIPSIITPIEVSATDAKVNWFAVSDINGNTIKYEATLSSFPTNQTFSDISNITFTFVNLEPSSTYNVTVVAKSTSGCTSPPGSAVFNTLPMETPTISPISRPTFSAYNYFVTVGWNQVAGATSYSLRSSRGLNRLLTGNSAISTIIIETCPQSDQIVTYEVKANSARSETPWSSAGQVTLPKCPPPPGGRIAMSSTVDSDISPQKNSNTEIEVFPNPAQKELTIQLPETAAKETSIFFVNLIGETKKMGTIPKGGRKVRIDLQSIESGIYLIRIENILKTLKLIVQ